MRVSQWNNCYDDNWNGLIVPEAFSHPAKFSPGLIRRIYRHCLEMGYLRKGELVVDCFGGIGAGGIMAAPMGLRWVGCELEEKFVNLAKQNFAFHERAWSVMGYPMPVIIQGDSRRLSEVLQEADLVCTSPPWEESIGTKDQKFWDNHNDMTSNWRGATRHIQDYGSSPGQIGNMKAGSVDAICTSPPYAEMDRSGFRQNAMGNLQKALEEGRLTGRESIRLARKGKFNPNTDRLSEGYGNTDGNIGNLRSGSVEAVVTSPPYSEGSGHKASDRTREILVSKSLYQPCDDYGNSKGQIGTTQGDTYWQAVADVYRECHKILKPSGVLVVVVKSYIKAGRRVPLPMQTLKLLIHLGFEPLERIKAMLVKDEIHNGLFGEIRKVKERKSFFRRLAEKKGSPRIDFEEILVCKK